MSSNSNPIPAFDLNGNLPPGDYVVSLDDIKEKLSWTPRRQELIVGLEKALNNLKEAGVKKVYIDGSFTTNKDEPGDVDGCWDFNSEIDADMLDPVFLDINPPRKKMKERYGVDFLIAGICKGKKPGRPIQLIEEFFKEDRDFNHKGILILEF